MSELHIGSDKFPANVVSFPDLCLGTRLIIKQNRKPGNEARGSRERTRVRVFNTRVM